MLSIEAENIAQRMRAAISLSWRVFSHKVGNGLIPINKEASMQLQFAYVLQQLLPLIQFHKHEKFLVELETGVNAAGGEKSIDLLFSCAHSTNQDYRIAVEMKCYRTRSSSGGLRGATDIFMKEVYFDFFLLEQYVFLGHANAGVSLVMNDMERLVHPKKKDAKCWRYDTSQGATFGTELFETPIGGKEVNFQLEKEYQLTWEKRGSFWFMETEGVESNAV